MSDEIEGSPDVLIVAGQDDEVAVRLGKVLETKGRRVTQVTGMTAARLFTIHVRSGSTVVSPSIPIFMRASAWWQGKLEAQSSDERFLRMEAHSTLSAGTALSAARVINRPTRNGSVLRVTWGYLASMDESDRDSTDRELYSSGREAIDSDDDSMWGEDGNFAVAPISQLPRGAPFRGRRVNPAALYEIVAVVGNRAFPATTDSRTLELNLAARSLSLAHRMNVHFSTITWAIGVDSATPVRLNTAPELGELRYAWNEVAGALCEDLLK